MDLRGTGCRNDSVSESYVGAEAGSIFPGLSDPVSDRMDTLSYEGDRSGRY